MNPSEEFLKTMIGPLLVCTKDKNTAVKTGSERALIDVLLLKAENNRMKVVAVLMFVLLLLFVYSIVWICWIVLLPEDWKNVIRVCLAKKYNQTDHYF